MEIRFNLTGAARKAFVVAVGDLVGWERKQPSNKPHNQEQLNIA